jgi:hypothetical protein
MVTKTHVICRKPPEVVHSSDQSIIDDSALSQIVKLEYLLKEESQVHRAAAHLLADQGYSVPDSILSLPITPSLEMLND